MLKLNYLTQCNLSKMREMRDLGLDYSDYNFESMFQCAATMWGHQRFKNAQYSRMYYEICSRPGDTIFTRRRGDDTPNQAIAIPVYGNAMAIAGRGSRYDCRMKMSSYDKQKVPRSSGVLTSRISPYMALFLRTDDA